METSKLKTNPWCHLTIKQILHLENVYFESFYGYNEENKVAN